MRPFVCHCSNLPSCLREALVRPQILWKKRCTRWRTVTAIRCRCARKDTASVRMLQEHGYLYNQTQRVFYAAPCSIRKAAKGRYRQFYQIGYEAYGLAGPDIDAELIGLGWACWQALGIESMVRLDPLLVLETRANNTVMPWCRICRR